MIAVGLAIVGNETDIASGKYDRKLDIIGEWFKKLAPRPVFLRIGYEFDGTDWNHYVPETYIPAYKHIKDHFDAAGIHNVLLFRAAGSGNDRICPDERQTGIHSRIDSRLPEGTDLLRCGYQKA